MARLQAREVATGLRFDIPDVLLEAILERREAAVVITHLIPEEKLADLLHAGGSIATPQPHPSHRRLRRRTLVSLPLGFDPAAIV
jgi:hypothetical protein